MATGRKENKEMPKERKEEIVVEGGMKGASDREKK